MSEQELQNKVYIAMDTSEHTDEQAILGVYTSKEKAKIKIAEYVLSKEIHTSYLYIVEETVK